MDPAATSANVTPGGDVYEIRAYVNDSNYYSSKRFTVTMKDPYTADSVFAVGNKVTVDTERIAESSDAAMDAYFNGEITYQWYRDGSAISGATGESYTPISSDVGKKIYAKVSYGTVTLDTIERTVNATAVADLTVNCVGKINYTVSGQTVTVNHSLACKVGYLSGGKYVALTPTKNSNGTYTFTAPDGVTEVLLIVKGDVTGDGRINVGDTVKVYSHVKGTALLTDAKALFTADVTGDGRINVGDTVKVYSHVKATSLLTW